MSDLANQQDEEMPSDVPEEFNLFLDEVEEAAGFEPIIGKVPLRVTGIKYVESKDKKTPSVNVELTVREGANQVRDADGNMVNPENRKVWSDQWLSAAYLPYFKKFFSTLVGEPFNERIQASSRAELAQEVERIFKPLIGEVCVGVLDVENYQKTDGGMGRRQVLKYILPDVEEAPSHLFGGTDSTPPI